MANSETLSVHLPLADIAQPKREPQIDLDKLIPELDWALREPGATVLVHGDLALYLTEKLAAKSGRVRSSIIHAFDELNVEAQHAGFEAFIRQIADRRAPVHFVLCGVSEALRELVAAHESCYNFGASQTTEPCGISESDFADQPRKAQDADQKNLYLISERLFWDMFNDPTFAGSFR
jgi:hypothetical protein